MSDVSARILARMSVSVSVSASWNSSLTVLTVDVVAVSAEQLFERLRGHGRRDVVVEQRAQFLVENVDRYVLTGHQVTADRVE